MEQGIDIMAYLGALKRRWWQIILVFVVGTGLALGVAYILPPVYESSARILVESQQIPNDLARSTVTASAAERLALIEQRLMTRQNLLGIIDRLDLFAERDDLSRSEQVGEIRAATTFRNISFDDGSRRRQANVSAFVITYRDNQPRRASRVTNEFVTSVLEQNLRAREARATKTHDFFQEQVQRLASELLALETEIAGFKNQNDQALPGSLDFRLSELSSLQERIFSREQRRIQLEEERRALEKALESGVSRVDERNLSPEERDLRSLRRSLVQKRSVYAESHPEIRSLVARIEALENSIQPASLEEDGEQVTAGEAQIARQIALIDSQLSLIEDQQTDSESRIAELETSIDETPKVEMKLRAFNRQYEELQTQYQAAVQKQAAAATGEKLEVNQQAERFEVIEQARAPREPVAPPRELIAAGGAAVSLGLGVGLALLLEILNAAIRTAGDLERRLQLTPVVTVPYIRTRAEIRRRRQVWASWILIVVVVIPGALWAIDQYYLPLVVLAERFFERTGLDNVWRMIELRLG